MEETHPYLKPVDLEDSFKLKNDHDQVIAEILTLDALKEAIDGVPNSALLFHMDGRNDFSIWVQKVIGCKALGKELAKVKIDEKKPDDTRKQLVNLLDYTLNLLKEV